YGGEDFSDPIVQRVDAGVNFAWGTGNPAAGVPADHFSVRWSGYVSAKTTANHTLSLTADDGVRLWVDGELLIDAWDESGSSTRTASVHLTADQWTPILLEYREATGVANIRLGWSSLAQTFEYIPAARLLPAGEP